jgi:hypothetical protein
VHWPRSRLELQRRCSAYAQLAQILSSLHAVNHRVIRTTEGRLNPKGNAGWQKDGIDAKLSLLIKEQDKSFDMISGGAPPNDFSYSSHGCSFSRPSLDLDKNELVLVAHCPKQIEMFFFRWNDDKTGELIRVDLASSTLSGGALYATCKIGQ